MFHTVQDFLIMWVMEAQNTIKLLAALHGDVLTKRLIPNYRTIGQLVWHILETPKEMLEHTGLTVDGPEFRSKPPKTAGELLDMHLRVVESVARQVEKNWSDKDLEKTDMMYGEKWTRYHTLTALVHHLVHHRGQMTVLMRLAGLQVPGIYGPAREEWKDMGMEPPVL